MTLTEFQSMLHQMYQGDTASPSSTDEDWEVRTKLLEVAISMWASERGINWKELFKTASGTTSLGTTITLSTPPATGAYDYRQAAGYLRIKIDGTNWTYIPIKTPTQSELFKSGSSNPKFAWITGSRKVGYTINLSFTVAASLSWELPYWKDPFIPSVGTDVLEMSDPMFALYFVLSKLHENDGEGDRATLAFSMRVANEEVPPYQDNAVEDDDYSQGVGGFGV